MKFITNPNYQSSWKQGDLEAPYSKLLAVFGEPVKMSLDEGDGKVRVEWTILFEDLTYATIHDWKEGLEPAELVANDHDRWSVGGQTPAAVLRVREAIATFKPARAAKMEINGSAIQGQAFPESARSFVAQALRVAAVQYATDARLNAEYPRVRDQFLEQAARANRLADELEVY